MSEPSAEIMDLMLRHGIGAFDYADGETRLSRRLTAKSNEMQILSPAPGRFSSDHPSSPRSAYWPRSVRNGDIVGWLSVGPLVMAVRADRDGVLGKPVVDDGSLVGYGTRLF